jgi:hypothetical protein
MPMVGGKKYSYDKKGIAAAKKAAGSDWDDETAEMIKRSQIMSELNIGEDGIRTKKSSGDKARAASAKKRKTVLPKNAAKRKAIQQIMKTGIIPASPTR